MLSASFGDLPTVDLYGTRISVMRTSAARPRTVSSASCESRRPSSSPIFNMPVPPFERRRMRFYSKPARA